MKLSRREKVLVTILLFVILNVGIIGYVIMPMYAQGIQLQEEANALKLDLDMKLLLVEASSAAQKKQEDILADLNQDKVNFLPPLAPEVMDAFLDEVIGPVTSAWRMLGIGYYDLANVRTDGSPMTLSYISKAEASVSVNAGIPTVMKVMKRFQELPVYAGIKDIQVSSNEATFVVEFYLFHGEQAE